jgi:hypothetical protein
VGLGREHTGPLLHAGGVTVKDGLPDIGDRLLKAGTPRSHEGVSFTDPFLTM